MKYKVGIVMGSDSDLPVIEKATNTLSALGIEFEVHVYSAHRTPDEAAQYAQSAQERGIGVLIGNGSSPCRRNRGTHHPARYRDPLQII